MGGFFRIRDGGFIGTHSFAEHFPRTTALLDQARGQVFPDYSVGLICLKSEDREKKIPTGTFLHSAECGADSMFDLASLTKVLCTTTLCVVAEKKKKLTLTEPIQTFFPDFPSNKVTVSHLLNHSSGLLAHLDLHADFHAPDGLGDFDAFSSPILARVKYEEKIIATWRPDLFEKECVYSDFGFMLLGWMLEQIGQMPLDALFQEWVAQPAGISELQFLPITPNVLPTEDCPWRGRVLRGEVHDDNCYVLGGVAGHAGLFGTTRAVLALAKIWLLGEKPLQKKLIQKYWNTTHVVGSSRVLGWDGISQESSTGRYFSKNSRGHLGFTGTSLWIDPDRELIVTLLTNRVHPTRRNDSIKKFRPEFHDSLMHELGFARP